MIVKILRCAKSYAKRSRYRAGRTGVRHGMEVQEGFAGCPDQDLDAELACAFKQVLSAQRDEILNVADPRELK
jgi:hypothetical protein